MFARKVTVNRSTQLWHDRLKLRRQFNSQRTRLLLNGCAPFETYSITITHSYFNIFTQIALLKFCPETNG